MNDLKLLSSVLKKIKKCRIKSCSQPNRLKFETNITSWLGYKRPNESQGYGAILLSLWESPKTPKELRNMKKPDGSKLCGGFWSIGQDLRWSGLVFSGPDRRWYLTQLGEDFIHAWGRE